MTKQTETAPERIWIDLRGTPISGKWRVYTAPNPFTSAEYARTVDVTEDQFDAFRLHPAISTETPDDDTRAGSRDVWDGKDLARRIFEYCDSVKWGQGRAMMTEMDMEEIVREWAKSASTPATRADANADFRAEWKACDAELLKKDQRAANFWFLTGRYGGLATADELAASRERPADHLRYVDDDLRAADKIVFDEFSDDLLLLPKVYDIRNRIASALQAARKGS